MWRVSALYTTQSKSLAPPSLVVNYQMYLLAPHTKSVAFSLDLFFIMICQFPFLTSNGKVSTRYPYIILFDFKFHYFVITLRRCGEDCRTLRICCSSSTSG